MTLPRSGDLIYLDGSASPQFATRAIQVRVIRVLDLKTYIGWTWLVGYQLNERGEAIEQRQLFLRVAGIRILPCP